MLHRPSLLLFPVMVALSGCNKWIDQEPACRYDVYDWSNDLLSHIRAGDGLGAFDYDPEDVPRQTLRGSYDAESGDYGWITAYAPSYFLTGSEVEGYGTAWHNGDLDILQTESATDVLGVSLIHTDRVKRVGCGMVVESWSREDESDRFAQVGAYIDDTIFSWSSNVPGYTRQGSWHANLSRTETIEADDGTYYSSITTKPAGFAEGVIAWTDSDFQYDGTTRRRFDGGTETVVSQVRDGVIVAEVTTNTDYDGSGTTTYAYSDGSLCELTMTVSGYCTDSCSAWGYATVYGAGC